ncbi:hypothetical protein T484DRAFT_1777767 [Baffinella frigidus]|nr:hypothetical protein T484DRAFT_1777767 [Cryptophyta sp. CCMP2293]
MLAGICALVMVFTLLGWVVPLYLSHGSATSKAQQIPIETVASLRVLLDDLQREEQALLASMGNTSASDDLVTAAGGGHQSPEELRDEAGRLQKLVGNLRNQGYLAQKKLPPP